MTFPNESPNPRLRTCPRCHALVRQDDRHCPYCAQSFEAPLAASFSVRRWLRHPNLVTHVLGLACILAFMGQWATEYFVSRHGISPAVAAAVDDNPDFLRLPAGKRVGVPAGQEARVASWLNGAEIPRAIWHGHQYWRWLTYAFLHGPWYHLAMNLYALAILCRLCEQVWDRRSAWAGFVFTGVTGGLLASLQMFWAPNSAEMATVGASGAICGFLGMLLGAYLGPYRRVIGDFLGRQVTQWAVMIAAFSVLMPGVSWTGHLGGFLGGYVLGRWVLIPHARHFGGRRHTALAWAAGGVCAAGIAGWAWWLASVGGI